LNHASNESTFENREHFSQKNSKKTDRAFDEIPEKKFKGLEIEILKPVLGGDHQKSVFASHKSQKNEENRIETVKP